MNVVKQTSGNVQTADCVYAMAYIAITLMNVEISVTKQQIAVCENCTVFILLYLSLCIRGSKAFRVYKASDSTCTLISWYPVIITCDQSCKYVSGLCRHICMFVCLLNLHYWSNNNGTSYTSYWLFL